MGEGEKERGLTDGDVHPVVDSEEELEKQTVIRFKGVNICAYIHSELSKTDVLDITRHQRLTLSRLREVRERDLIILQHSILFSISTFTLKVKSRRIRTT